MKIDNSNAALGAYASQARVARRGLSDDTQPLTAPTSDDGDGGDSVAINPMASRISALERQVGGEPSFDAAKVDAIKAAIASGSFTINSDKIADSLIVSTQEMLAQ